MTDVSPTAPGAMTAKIRFNAPAAVLAPPPPASVAHPDPVVTSHTADEGQELHAAGTIGAAGSMAANPVIHDVAPQTGPQEIEANAKAEFLAAAAAGKKTMDEVRGFIIDHEAIAVEAENSIENLIERAKKFL